MEKGEMNSPARHAFHARGQVEVKNTLTAQMIWRPNKAKPKENA
jgi:hypothetical protein